MALRLLLLLLFCSALSLCAQRYADVAYVNQAFSPSIYAKDSTEARIFETNLTLRPPLSLKDSTSFLLLSISLNQTQYSFSDERESMNFGGGYIGLIHFRQWTPKWSTLSTLQGGSFSNMNDYNWSGLQYLGGSIVRWQFSPNLRLGAGFLAGYRVRFLYFVPLAEVYWQINRQWNILGLAPGNLVINYQINHFQGVGFEYEALGNVFSINRQDIDYLSESSPNFPWTYLRFGLYGDQFFGENVAIRLQAGVDVKRNLLAFDRGNLLLPNENPQNFILAEYGIKPFIAFGVFYRVRN